MTLHHDDNNAQVRSTLHDRGICVVIPTYNNHATIRQVVESVLCDCSDVIVVDDGCTDSTADILGKIEGQKYTLQRSKGLGENQPDMMNLTTMNPATRRLIKVMPSDAEKTSEMFDLLLGDNLQGRKDFIAEYGYMYIDDADLS